MGQTKDVGGVSVACEKRYITGPDQIFYQCYSYPCKSLQCLLKMHMLRLITKF